MRKPHKYKVYDLMHRTVVSILQAGTLLILGKLGYDIYYWKRYQLPVKKEEFRKYKEKELAEKQAQEAEELAKQEQLQKEVKRIP